MKPVAVAMLVLWLMCRPGPFGPALQAYAAPSAAPIPQFKPPRTASGKPDFNGLWQVLNTANWNIQDHSGELGVPPDQGVVEGNDIPYQPWALAKKQDNYT